MTKTERVAAIAKELREMFPRDGSITLNLYSTDETELAFHGVSSFTEGTEFLRTLDIGDRDKVIVDTSLNPWGTLSGKANGVKFLCYCKGLPLSCKLVTETIRIPKRETVDTGEFVEIQQSRVVCGQEKELEPA